jgi:hypothetical protein
MKMAGEDHAMLTAQLLDLHPMSRCRACGFDHFPDHPWGEDGELPTHNICGCCGVEYGYSDETPEGCHAIRKHWVETERCAFWSWPREKPPADWSPSRQLRMVPTAFRGPDDDRLIGLAAEYERTGLHLQRRRRLP